MKKIRIIGLFIVLSFVVLLGNVKALTNFPNSITVESAGDNITTNQSGTVVNYSGSEEQYPHFNVKNSDKGKIICTSGLDFEAPRSTTICTKSSFSGNQDKGVAYIINTILGEGGKSEVSNDKYYWVEVLTNDYLGTYNPGSSSYITLNIINNNNVKIAGTGLSYKEILDGAISYAAADYNSALTVNNQSSDVTLIFTKGTDGYYYSNEVEIKGSPSPVLGTINNNKFSYTKNGNKYTFKISQASITSGGTETFEITVSTPDSSYYTAAVYSCGSDVQNVALTQTVENRIPGKSIKISGSISVDKTRLVINKVDNNNVGVKGATITVTGPNNYSKEFVTDGNPIVIEDLEFGEYVITETKVPDGYYGSTEANKVVLSASKMEETVTIKNNLTETIIDKVSAVDGKELKGATLQILNNKKEKISCTILDEKGNKKILDECMWISTDKPTTVVGLPIGKYYLKEVIAPEGYVLSDKMVQFEVKSNGKKTEVKMTNELEVEVPNTLSTRSALLLTIAMFDIALGIGMLIYVKKNKNKE